MTITLNIIENGHIVLVSFTDPWQADEMYPLFKRDQAYRDTFQKQNRGTKVHLIADFTHSKQVAQGFLQARKSPSLSHPTNGMTIVVGANNLVEAISKIGFRAVGYTNMLFVKTLDEAVMILREAIRRERSDLVQEQ
jgi:hypothetical protein